MERIGSDTRAYHTLTSRFVWDQPEVYEVGELEFVLLEGSVGSP